MFLPLAGCAGILDPAGPVGASEKVLLFDALGIMLAIIVPVIVATLAFAWWYRASNARARYQPDFAYSGQLELVVWGIPALVVLLLGGLGWVSSHQLDPYKPLPSKAPPLEVDVVALDWKWLFIYPGQGVASVNDVVVPAGVPVRFRITSASVLNTFFVPRVGSIIYAMNGMATEVNLQADKPGVLPGLSGHFSGDGFANMHFNLRAVPPAQFAQWVAATHAGGPVLDVPGYRALARQSLAEKPFTYRAVQPHLFEAVVTRAVPDGPGPTQGRGGPGISPRSEGSET